MLLMLITLAMSADNPCTDKNKAGDLCNSLEGEPGVCMPCGAALVCDLDDEDSAEVGCEELDSGGTDGKEEGACGCNGGGAAAGLAATALALLGSRRRRAATSPRTSSDLLP